MTILRSWWSNHGTKILGFGSALLGAATYVDEQTIHAIEFVSGPHWGPIFSHGLMVVAGLMTAWRGFLNSQKKLLDAGKS